MKARLGRPRRWQWGWWALLMCAALGAMVLWITYDLDDGEGAPVAGHGVQPAAARSAAAGTGQAPTAASPDADNIASGDDTQALARATGWPTAELEALRAELRGHPQGEAELRRVMGWLAFSGQWQAFDEQRRAGAERDVLRPLAMQLDAALPHHWRQGELTGAQAVQLKALLLDVLHTDAATRQAEMNRWLAEHPLAGSANTVATSR